MNRRELFKAMAGVATATSAGLGVASIQRHGLLTIESHMAHKRITGEKLHVYVDGVDVTRNAYEANDVEGYALVFCSDERDHRDWTKQGHRHIGGDGGACRMRLTGHVVIAPGS
jgi:hypothetical protein